ncbi:sulfotransferase [Roseivivax sp. THAF30]|uniref:sulfotransferase family protein n=1 Tax=Roseivivax sp. THAF30 TaxID=2587852 RepID=UPI001268F25C|nr:sulfotransferase [Roseivivax sp. THAF30]QFT62747.1 Sulfotransferase domain protein [Roseivivax sp. THAF30]
MGRVPDFLVIGAQKAASTYLQFCLSDHPDIWMPHGETPYFEDPDYRTLGPDYLSRQLADRPERILGLKRPQWIGRAEVPARICRDLPKARLIAVLRNPVERAVSAYYHYMRGGFLPIMDPEIGLARLLDEDTEYSTSWPRAWEILEFGLYHKHLSKYGPFFERGQVQVCLQEDVISEPLNTARTMYEFLGVDKNFTPTRMNKRPQAVVYDLRRLGYLQKIDKLAVLKNSDNTRSLGYRNEPARIGYRVWRAVDESLLEWLLPSHKPSLSAQLLKRLAEFYEQDVLALEPAIGRNLSRWRIY